MNDVLMSMDVMYYLHLQDGVEPTPENIATIAVPIKVSETNEPLTGEALTKYLCEFAPVGNFLKMIRQNMLGKPDLSSLVAELGVERKVELKIPQLSGQAKRPQT